MKTIIASLTASLTLLTISLSYAKEPDDLAAILKETQVTEKILEGALSQEYRYDLVFVPHKELGRLAATGSMTGSSAERR